jgi:hypothetical protein
MAEIKWDEIGKRLYETGIDHGVLYIPNAQGEYSTGYAWNGLTAVSESPSGAEANPQYADNIKYLNLVSAEEFGATIEAFTYPEAFAQCDGTAVIGGIQISQQVRRSFGFSYRTLIGNDLVGTDFGYKIHLVYGCDAAPSEKSRSTVNDSPEAATFSWEITTNPVPVPGTNPATNKPYRPTAHITIDSTKVTPANLAAFEQILYGTSGVDARMPAPAAVMALFAGDVIEVNPTAPTYVSATKTITIPTVTGVTYTIDGSAVTGSVVITTDTVVEAMPNAGYKFPVVSDDDWVFEA